MSDPVVTIRGLVKQFAGGSLALNGLDLSLAQGELFGVVGPDGAGKTTLLRILAGVLGYDHGEVRVFGQLVSGKRGLQAVGYIPQRFSLYTDLTVAENLLVSYPKGRSVFGSLGFRRDATVQTRVEEIAEAVFLQDRLDEMAGILSHGQKQWLEIGMLLIQDPELIMLDEPVAGMSVRERQQTGELLARICQGRSMLIIEHDMDFVRSIAHKVTVMHQGKILVEGSMDKVHDDPRVKEVYLGH